MNKFILETLDNWQTEPDPLILYDLVLTNKISDKDVIEAGTQLLELKDFSTLNIIPITKKLEEILPYFKKIYEEIEKLYPTEEILFAGRDCRILYFYFKIFAQINNKNTERFIQIPGSQDFYLEKSRDNILEIKLLESFNITKQKIEEGRKYVFVDTGFEGSVGLSFRKFVQTTLDVKNDLSSNISITLVSRYTNNPTVTQFTDFGPAEGEMYKELREYVRCKIERGNNRDLYTEKFSRINDYVAILMQNTPQYHGPYNHTVNYENKIISVSNNRGLLFSAPQFYVINAEFVNPVVALRVDLWMINRLINTVK
jgi:hypothetical protein